METDWRDLSRGSGAVRSGSSTREPINMEQDKQLQYLTVLVLRENRDDNEKEEKDSKAYGTI